MKKVLIITYHFPPSRKIGAIRSKGLAKYLPLFGWKPIFIVPLLFEKPDENFDVIETHPSYQKILPFYFSRRGRKNLERISKPLPPFYKKVYSFFRGMLDIPDNRVGWFPFAYEVAKKTIEEENIRHLISIFGPATCHIIGSRLKRRYGNIFWIADFRDPWTLYRKMTLRNKFERKLEMETLKSADIISIVSEEMAEDMKGFYKNKKVFFIPNGFDPEEMADGNQELTKKFTITHTGSLDKKTRNPEILLVAVSQLIENGKISKKDIELRFLGKKQEWIVNLGKKYNIKEVIKYYGWKEREKVINFQRKSQILFLLQTKGIGEAKAMTGKIYEYFSSLRPILSIGEKENIMKKILKKTNAGIHCSTLEEIKEVLLNWYKEWKLTGVVKYRGEKKEILKYSHIEMAKKFAKILEDGEI